MTPSRPCIALRRSGPYCLSIFFVYVLSAAVGAAMAHSGSHRALSRRDAIVAEAHLDQSSIDYRAGRRIEAALHDAAANFVLAALPQMIAGLTIVLPYVTTAYQGWAGGIVSVDARHASRLRHARSAAYYVGVLLLQFLAFSLCIGGGIRCGVVTYAQNRETGWRLWRYRFSQGAIADLCWVTAVSLPLFVLAALFEFLSPWNA